MGELTRSIVLAALAICTLQSPAAALAALEPHRAAYHLSLAGRNPTFVYSSVSGNLLIEWERACDGWLSHQRLDFVASQGGLDGGETLMPSLRHDVRFSAWEAIDGSKLRYSIRSYDGNALREEFLGEAAIKSFEEGGVASFSKPDRRDVVLPPGTVFPTDHINRILAGVNKGQAFVSFDVFDGWGFDALTQVTSAIGSQRPFKPRSDRELEAEPGGIVWPVSMAYYNATQTSDLPEFEARFMLNEQGVLQELVLDYTDFRLKATLAEFEILKKPSC